MTAPPGAARLARVRALFDRTVALSATARAPLLDALRAEDPGAAAELAALLDAHDAADSGALFPPLPLAAPPAPGTRIGPWRVETPLGAGGMGVVVRAVRAVRADPADAADGAGKPATVALKLPRAGLERRAELAGRFAREHRVLAALDHPGIARFVEAGVADDGRPWIAMELVEGEPLDRWCDRRRLDLRARLALVAEVCRAVGYAHARGVVHRDLKPGNVLVDRDGAPRVVDFGLARLLAPDATPTDVGPTTRPGAVPYTPGYAAPEQRRGSAVGPRADVYALGVLLHELLVGERPAPAADGEEPIPPSAVLRGLLEADPDAAAAVGAARATAPAALVRALAPDVDAVVCAALAPRPADRPRDATALAEELARVLGGTRPLARAGGRARRARRLLRRMTGARPVGVVGGAVAFFAIVAGVAALARAPRATAAPETAPASAAPAGVPASAAATTIAVLPFAVHGPEEARFLRTGLVELLAQALDGAGPLHTVASGSVLRVADDPGDPGDPGGPGAEDAVARALGAGLVVSGSVVETTDGRVRLTARLRRVGAPPDGTPAQAEGQVDSLFALADRLAAALLARAYPGQDGALVRAAARTTGSLAAFKAYLQGDAAWRAGDYQGAADGFAQAVALDSTYAFAHLRLAQAVMPIDATPARLNAALAAARRHAARLAPVDRLRIEATVVGRTGDFASSDSLWRRLLALAPEDREGTFALADLRFHQNPYRGRSIAESRDGLERSLAVEPFAFEALDHVGVLALRDARVGQLDTLIALGEAPDAAGAPVAGAVPRLRLWRTALVGDSAARAATLAWLAAQPAGRRLGVLWRLGTHQPGSALLPGLAALTARLDDGPLRAWAHMVRADALAAAGRFAEADAALARALRDAPLRVAEVRAHWATLPFRAVSRAEREGARAALAARTPALDPEPVNPPFVEHPEGTAWLPRAYLLGLLDATLGDAAGAERAAALLEAWTGPEAARRYARSLAAGVRARLAWERGRPAEALAWLERGGLEVSRDYTPVHLGTQVPERWLRAEALRALGRDEEAYGWYASLAELSPHEGVYRAPAALAMAALLERRGDRAGAAARRAEAAALRRAVRDAMPGVVP